MTPTTNTRIRIAIPIVNSDSEMGAGRHQVSVSASVSVSVSIMTPTINTRAFDLRWRFRFRFRFRDGCCMGSVEGALATDDGIQFVAGRTLLKGLQLLTESGSLRTIKWLHTLVWVFFVVCIGAIPFHALRDELGQAALFIGIVFVEVLILMANRWSCPLTSVAARYTEERSANFDIYLPQWLARHNKTIFGGLYLLGALLTLVKWLMG